MTNLNSAQAELRLALQRAHTSDAQRAETEARLLDARAAVLRADAQVSRSHAESTTAQAALLEVRRLCDLTIRHSIRAQAIDQTQDTLAVIDAITGDALLPGDAAWGSVWLYGNWRYLTEQMTPEEREHAADAVARWSAALNSDDPNRDGKLEGLRWWRD